MSYTFQYVQTDSLDPNVLGSDTKITFICEEFTYYAFCLNNVLQYVKGEYPDSYLNWSVPPTEQQISGHEDRRHAFNQDQSIVQNWIDTL